MTDDEFKHKERRNEFIEAVLIFIIVFSALSLVAAFSNNRHQDTRGLAHRPTQTLYQQCQSYIYTNIDEETQA